MHRALTHPLFLATCCIAGAAAFAQVDYGKPEQRNPQKDPDVERGYQQNQQEHQQRQQQQKEQAPKGSTDTSKGQGESYGKDWQEKQLGTQGKTRTW